MQGSLTPLSVLGPQADDERHRIREQFEAGAGARETVRALCELADNNIRQIFGEVLRVHNTPVSGLSLLALGGYGRKPCFRIPTSISFSCLAATRPRKSSGR